MRPAAPWLLALILASCAREEPAAPGSGTPPTTTPEEPPPPPEPTAAALPPEGQAFAPASGPIRGFEAGSAVVDAAKADPAPTPMPSGSTGSMAYAFDVRTAATETDKNAETTRDRTGWLDGGDEKDRRRGDGETVVARLQGDVEEVTASEHLAKPPADALTMRLPLADQEASEGVGLNGTPVLIFGDDTEVTFAAPARFLPRSFYFENTYLGGSAAYAERLRRLSDDLADETRPYEIVQAEVQPFDPPRTEGLALTASVDATHIDRPRRVFLQVGLRGSSRYGWRRPPLDVVLVIDHPALQRGTEVVTGFVVDVLRQLGPADRLGIVLAGAEPEPFLELTRINSAQQHLAQRIDELRDPQVGGQADLADAMGRAGEMLAAASDAEATVPGSKTLLVLSGEQAVGAIEGAARAAHALTVKGCVTSVFALEAPDAAWWQVANAGYGNLHRVGAHDFAHAIETEMKNLARVVARLVRVNVRLGKEANVIRVLGTRVLEAREAAEVKARERATDINLSKSLGITSDRGEDDDGIQTVIPYFYGDDSHVILIELWVTGPGSVADVTVRYKDMVNLDNSTARASVKLGARPQPPTPEQLVIARNVHGFELAENLQKASDAVMRNDLGEAVRNLGAASGMAAATNALDRQAVEGLKAMVERGDWQANPARRATVQETLLISGQRRVGDTNQKK